MGYMKQEVVIIQDVDYKNDRKKLIQFVKSIWGMRKYVAISKVFTNGYFSAVLWPDGSKEGWTTSNKVDEYREKLMDYAREHDLWFIHIVLSADRGNTPFIEEIFRGRDTT